MKHRRNLIIGAVLSAATAALALQTVSAPQQDSPPASPWTESQTSGEGVSATDTPLFQGCAYSWANRPAPELTETLDAQIKKINPDASATATQFGEDCLKADGSVTFGVMQTDFKVRLPVDDLSKEEEFGNWVAQVMQLVTAIPREEIPGLNYGFVEFWFEKNESERIVFRVPIQDYLNAAQEKTGAVLFQMFYTPP